ncbi:hypothetical protein N9903_01155 [bacterium]|nr:hypothetical protein [bacterium]
MISSATRCQRGELSVRESLLRTLPEDVLLPDLGVEILYARVVIASQEGEGGDDGAGADAGDELELGTGAGLRPTVQQARAKGAVVPTAGDGEEVRRGHRSRNPLGFAVCQLTPERLFPLLDNLVGVEACPVAHFGNSRDDGLTLQFRRHRRQSARRRAPLEHCRDQEKSRYCQP